MIVATRPICYRGRSGRKLQLRGVIYGVVVLNGGYFCDIASRHNFYIVINIIVVPVTAHNLKGPTNYCLLSLLVL